MELLQLQYFQTVARTGNITQAAKELYISQPCLSRSISRLERSLGVPLFDRKGRNIVLNQYGKVYLKRVDAALKELADGQQALSDMSERFSKTVSVGAVTLRFLPRLFNQFLHQNEQVNFRLINVKPHGEVERDLQEGVIDIAFTFAPIAGDNVTCKLLTEEEILLAVPENHPLAAKNQIDLSATADEPYINLSGDYDLALLSRSLFIQAGFTPKVRFESPTADFIASLVSEGFGCALFPESWKSTVKLTGIRFVHLLSPHCRRSIYLSSRESNHQSPASAQFIDFVSTYFRA